MDTDLDTLATALYVTTDDLLKAHPEQAPARPAVGIVPLGTAKSRIRLGLTKLRTEFGDELAAYRVPAEAA